MRYTNHALIKEILEEKYKDIDSPVTDTTVMGSCWFGNDAFFAD